MMINSQEILQVSNRDAEKSARNDTEGHISSGDFGELRLIGDLANRFVLDGEGISAILALIRQIRALRKMLRALLATSSRLPAPLRARVHAELMDRQCTPLRIQRRLEQRFTGQAVAGRLVTRLPQ